MEAQDQHTCCKGNETADFRKSAFSAIKTTFAVVPFLLRNCSYSCLQQVKLINHPAGSPKGLYGNSETEAISSLQRNWFLHACLSSLLINHDTHSFCQTPWDIWVDICKVWKRTIQFTSLSNLQKEGKMSSELHMQDRLFYWRLRGQLTTDLVYENFEGCCGERRTDVVREAAFKKKRSFLL